MCKDLHLDITQLNLMKYGVTSVIDCNLYERRREVSRDSIYAYSLYYFSICDREKSVQYEVYLT